MNMGRFLKVICLLNLGIFFSDALCLKSMAAKSTVGIQTVDITKSLRKAVAQEGQSKLSSLERVADSLEQQLISSVHNTRKFTIVSRGDLNTILKEQNLQSVLSDPNDANVAQAFKAAGCKYALIVTVDDFADVKEELRAEGGQAYAYKRNVRLSSVVKIYDTTTTKLLETANFQLEKKEGKKLHMNVNRDGARSEQLLTEISREMAECAARRIVDVIYPAKTLAVTGKVVTINRGDGTGIEKGQIWDVYALGEELIDPDSGDVLGSEEVNVGKIKIFRITPKFSQAHIIEDFGISKLQIVRKSDNK